MSKEFDSRNNSLNLLRLILSVLVIISHSFVIMYGGGTPEPEIFKIKLGSWAVIAFFCISGYLIAGSRVNSGLANYLTKRVARIFPAYVAVQLVIVFLFAPISHFLVNGTFAGYLTTAPNPLNYLLRNLNLGMYTTTFKIGNTISDVPAGGNWDGALWTLFYEFTSYLLIGLLLTWVVRRRLRVVSVGLLWAAGVFAQAIYPRLAGWDSYTTEYGHNLLSDMVMLVPVFFGGSLIFLIQQRFKKFYWPVALACLLISGLGAFFLGQHYADRAELKMAVIAPFLTYFILWLTNTAKCGLLGRLTIKNDISYGVYIYGWPVQLLLMELIVHHIFPEPPLWLYITMAVDLAAIFAILSWKLIEKPVLDRVRKPKPDQSWEDAKISHQMPPEPESEQPVAAKKAKKIDVSGVPTEADLKKLQQKEIWEQSKGKSTEKQHN